MEKSKWNICLHCMTILSENTKFCPACGSKQDELPSQPGALPPRTILENRYIVGRVLGKGGFGITYLAYDTVLTSKIAIKELCPNNMVVRQENLSLSWCQEKMTEERACELFLREAQKMARTNQLSNVVTVHNTFQANHTAYIVMEYIEGKTLKTYIKEKGALSVKEMQSLIFPVMDAVAKLHELGMIHRDIKPDNLMIKENGEIVILDMGSAKIMDVMQQPMLETNMTIKTVSSGFSPLEQHSCSKDIGPWTDVYALSATIYYCLTKKRPEDANKRNYSEEYEHLEKPEMLSEYQWDVLQKGMALKIEDRFSSVEQLKNAFIKENDRSDDRTVVVPRQVSSKKTSSTSSEEQKVSSDKKKKLFKKQRASSAQPQKSIKKQNKTDTHSKKKRGIGWLFVPVAAIVVICAMYPFINNHQKAAAMSKEAFLDSEKKYNIRRIVFQEEPEEVPEYARDISQKQNEAILSWEKDEVLYVSSKATVVFPEDSSYLFNGFSDVESIDFGNKVDVSNVTNMEGMFLECYALEEIDVSSWDISNVTTTEYMFGYCENLSESKLQNMLTVPKSARTSDMFTGCQP